MNQKILLGYLLKNPHLCSQINEQIFSGEYLQIFKVLLKRQIDNQEISLSLIAKELSIMPEKLQTILSESYIQENTFRDLLSEENKLLELRLYETLIKQASQEAEQTEPKERFKIYQTLKEKLNSISIAKGRYQIYENPNLMDEWYANYDKVRPAGIKTGLAKLDEAIGGIGKTDLAIIIGDTNIGKTNLLLNIVLAALMQEKKVLFYSLEMTQDQLKDRLVAMAGEHNAFEIRERSIPKEQLLATVNKLKNLDIRMVDTGSISSTDIVNDIINERSRREVDLVAIDYLQRLDDQKGRNDNETQRIAGIARRLKNAALNYQVPIITPVQVDKASHKSGRIEVENVADSKVVANEADLALYIYQEEKKAEGLSGNIVVDTKLKVVKSRHTRKGQIFDLYVDLNCLRIEDDNIKSVLKYVSNK